MAGGIEVARAVVTIMPSLEGAQKTITKELTGATEPASKAAGKSSGKTFTSHFGDGLKKIGTVTAAAFASVGAAVAAVAKRAVSAFADYEQLSGGVETLFKTSSDQVLEYAQRAFKTSGMSANEYMSTVTSFSASLLSSLGGDTEKAAQVADMAMQDMSDNANKMGTDMSAIQTAYQGFAKQNYTMLDNLKLGYGGTKTEMQRLLADAQKISKVRYDINNLNDVYAAIHVIQTEMGITGTTAKEAMTTISGSAGMAKAAWQNVLTAVAGGGPGLSRAVDDLMLSVFGDKNGGGLLNNLIPVVETALNGIGSFISTAAPMILPRVTELVASLLPGFVAATTSILNAIVDQLPTLVQSITALIPQIIQSLATLIPQLASSGVEILKTILQGVLDNLPLILSSAASIISTLVSDLAAKLPELLPVAAQIITQLGAGIVQNAPQLITSAATAVGDFISGIISKLPEVLSTAGDIVKTMLSGIGEHMPGVINAFSDAMAKIVQAISDAFPNISDGITKIVTACKPIIDVVAANFTEVARIVAQAITDMIASLAPYTPAITSMVETVSANLPAIIDSFTNMFSLVKPIIDSFIELVKTIGQTVVDVVTAVGTNLSLIVDAFSSFNQSLAVPIKAVSDAISGMINAISDGIVKINNSIAGILDKLANVFKEVGDAAIKAGEGFKTVANAVVDLVRNTGVLDLAATLGAVAKGIKSINLEAKWSHDKNIGGAINEVGSGLQNLVSSAKGVDSTAKSMDTLSSSLFRINGETAGKLPQNIRELGKAIGDMVNSAGNNFGNLGTTVDNVLQKIKTLCAESVSAFKSLASEIKSTMSSVPGAVGSGMNSAASSARSGSNEINKAISYGMRASESSANNSFSGIARSASSAMSSSANAVGNGIGRMQGYFNNTRFNLGSYIRLPHFYMHGSFDAKAGSVPEVGVRWYDKGGIFSRPSIIGVGEKRPEFVGALDDLREIVREESNTANITLNVYGSEGQNVRELANIVIDRIRNSIDRQEAAFA